MAVHITARKRLALAAGSVLLSILPLGAAAQGAADFPHKPIERVAPFGAGGGTDGLARVFVDVAKKHTAQAVTALNKPSASGSIGLDLSAVRSLA